MIHTMYYVLIAVSAVRGLLILLLISLVVSYAYTQYSFFVKKSVTHTARYRAVMIVVLAFLIAMIPQRKELMTLMVLSQLDNYIQSRDINITDPENIGLSALSIENAILRIEESIKTDLENN